MDLSFLGRQQRAIAEPIIQQCAVSRIWFVTNVLKVSKIEEWQHKVLTDLDNGVSKISVRSGHGVGKTTLCSWCAIHFLLFRTDVKVIITSPSQKQLSDGLVPEIQKWISRLPSWMRQQLVTTTERVTRSPDNMNNFISFRTARKENPEALAGVHATSVMILVDEASGVDEIIYETGQGALSTDGAIAMLIGNPTRPSGFFFKTHTELNDVWKTYSVSCHDSSRVSDTYIETQRRTYGPDSREYKVRVLGEFPDSGADAVVPREYVESAQGREITLPTTSKTVWGLDPGRGGDPSGFVERTDKTITRINELRYDDTMRLTGWVKARWDELPSYKRPETIYVDAIGLGAGIADRLRELNLPVIAVNVSEAPSITDRYMRLRDELWYAVREWFEPHDVSIPTIEQEPLISKLTHELASVESEILSSGKLQVESKEKMKKRGIKSPNLADALIITFARKGSIASGSWATSRKYNADISKYRVPNLV